jgi:hypothetical protein
VSACRHCRGRGFRGEHYRTADPCDGEAPCPALPTVYVLGGDYCDAHAPDLLAARGAMRPHYAFDPEAGW